jgi:hypothetical protein
VKERGRWGVVARERRRDGKRERRNNTLFRSIIFYWVAIILGNTVLILRFFLNIKNKMNYKIFAANTLYPSHLAVAFKKYLYMIFMGNIYTFRNSSS